MNVYSMFTHAESIVLLIKLSDKVLDTRPNNLLKCLAKRDIIGSTLVIFVECIGGWCY